MPIALEGWHLPRLNPHPKREGANGRRGEPGQVPRRYGPLPAHLKVNLEYLRAQCERAGGATSTGWVATSMMWDEPTGHPAAHRVDSRAELPVRSRVSAVMA